jgi:hypothetical protein
MQISRPREDNGKANGLVPDYFSDGVLNIDFNTLREQGVRKVALDVDQTLAHHQGIEVTPEIAEYLNKQVADGVIEEIIIASNSLRDLSAFSERLDAKIVVASARVRKPRRKYFDEVCRVAGCKPNEMAMVGDRVLTDILGGNKAGFVTVLVAPHGPDMWLDRLILRRFWGARYLKRHKRPKQPKP